MCNVFIMYNRFIILGFYFNETFLFLYVFLIKKKDLYIYLQNPFVDLNEKIIDSIAFSSETMFVTLNKSNYKFDNAMVLK